MLETLRELSGVKPEAVPSTKEDLATPPPPPPPVEASSPSAVGTSPDPPLESGQSDEERTKPALPLSIDTSSVKRDGSDQGTETEEDEGMVLVGRPTDP